MQTYTLLELNEFIRQVFALNFHERFWVTCEIAQINQSRGHFYLDLVDRADTEAPVSAQLAAVLWHRRYISLRRKYKNLVDDILHQGRTVRLQVKVEFDERFGLKLMIQDIDPSYSIGQMELKRQEILQRLQAEALLHRNAQIPLPAVLQRIAIISSKTAAGLQDFYGQLKHNPYNYQFSTHLFPSAMQGEKTVTEMLQQLQNITKQKSRFDLVVVIRGGGAKLDLASFDSLELGRAVATFPLPVLTGIGHEIDETILDSVAHTALKTPTAVADFIINHSLHFESSLLELATHFKQIVKYKIENEKGQLKADKKLVAIYAKNSMKELSNELFPLQQRLRIALNNTMQAERERLLQLEKICKLLAPETILKRGFSLTLLNGKSISDVQEVKKGDQLETLLSTGNIKSIVS